MSMSWLDLFRWTRKTWDDSLFKGEGELYYYGRLLRLLGRRGRREDRRRRRRDPRSGLLRLDDERLGLEEDDELEREELRRYGWRRTFNNNFAQDFFQSLPASALPTQLSPHQCCTYCSPILAADCNINLSEVSAAEKNCQLCALLLRTVKRYRDEVNVEILREGSALKITNEGPRILRLCSDSEYLADPGEDVQISFPVLPEAQSPTRFALFRAWLRWCDKSHDCNKHAGESKLALPTRLLYVGDTDPNVLRLYRPENNDRVEYVALSHRWGEHPPTKNSPQFCTTDKNVKERRKRFNLSELPKTFRDAVRVTRELGIQYLWIDSLCIIQWNQEDWMREAKRMEGVFASAYCTIAATSAVDSNTGFLGRNVSGEYVCVQDASGRRFYVCTDIDDFDIDMEKVQLNKRAWVMQERVLSRRTIHFSDNQAYFECGEGVYCENLTRLESSRRKEFFMLDPNFPDRLLASGHQRTIEFIEFLFQDYSRRDLTVDADRCIAISGLEARIARARGCQNRYGIFQLYLHRNLLWQRSDNKKTERIGYKSQIVPSWSWMAYNGGIQFMDIPFGTVDWNDSLRFDKKRELALITDVGVFRNCSLEQRDTSYDILDSSKAKIGSIQYDIEASKDIQAERCVVVAKGSHENEHGLGNRKYYILVVRSTSVVGEYMRVGVGWIRSDYVVKRRLNVRVV